MSLDSPLRSPEVPNEEKADAFSVNFLSLVLPERFPSNTIQPRRPEEKLLALAEFNIQSPTQSPTFESVKPTQAEIDFLKKVATPEQIKIMKEEINSLAQDPETAIIEAVKKHRIVGIGEAHIRPINAIRDQLTVTMQKLKDNGVTHLALEIQKEDQAWLDQPGQVDGAKILNKYSGANEDFIEILNAAKNAGIKLVAVDTSSAETDLIKRTQERNDFMTNEIAGIVESDKTAHVLFYVGAHHLENSINDKGSSAAQQLRERGKKHDYSIETFMPAMDDKSTGLYTNIFAETALHGASINLQQTQQLKNLPEGMDNAKDHELVDGCLVGSFDNLLILPRDHSLQVYERAYGKNSAKLIPVLDRYCQSYIKRDEYDKATQLANRSLAIEKEASGENG